MNSRKYYVLSPDPGLPFIYGNITFSPIEQGIYSNLWGDRNLPEGLVANAKLTNPKKIVRRDLLSFNSGFVGRDNLFNLLSNKKFITNIKLHPCAVFYHDGEPVSGKFSFIEFRCFFDAFDYENSEYLTSEGENNSKNTIITSCTKLVIDESKTNQFDIFFLKNVDFFDPIITNRVLDELIKQKIRGIKVTPIEDYTWSE
jgi:hypothetical protein